MNHKNTRVFVLPPGLSFLEANYCTEHFTLNGLMIMLFLGIWILSCYFCFTLSLEQRREKLGNFFVVLRTAGNSDCSENYLINMQKEAKVKDRKSYSSMSSCQMPSYTPSSLWNPSNLKYSHLVKLVYVSLFS